MNQKQKLVQLAEAVRDYPQFKDQFRMFWEALPNVLNQEGYTIPGISFSDLSDGNRAEILMLDQTFIVRFRLAVLNGERVGVLSVSVPPSLDEDPLLWRIYFDIHGMVRDKPEAAPTHRGLKDMEFHVRMIGEFSEQYFLRLQKRLTQAH